MNVPRIFQRILTSASSGLKHPSHLTFTRSLETTTNPNLPKEARVVICGTGIVGNSVAYHLVEYGWRDIVVVEQEGQIGSGTSAYGSGTLALLKPVQEKLIIKKSIELYEKLEDEGHDIGLEKCGSLYLAQNRERMVLLKRRVSLNQPQGLECEVLGPKELLQYYPYLHIDDLQGGVYVPGDAAADPSAVCGTLARLAQEGGAKYIQNCMFKRLLTQDGRVSGVETTHGLIQCEYFVNCAGMWSWQLGQSTEPKVRVPVHPCEHFYLQTHPLSETLEETLPTLRDYDSGVYIRKWKDNSFLMGAFEKNAKPVFTLGIPSDWRNTLRPDWDHFAPSLNSCVTRLPILKGAELKSFINAPDNFTPDGKYIIGETPEIDNYFVAAGMNGNSLQGAGGIGHALAHWIREGEPPSPLLDFDVRRFVDVHNNRRFLYERVKETVGRQYAVLHPLQSEYTTAREVRCSPLYSALKSQGAVFGTRMCFERPLYFDSNYQVGSTFPEMPPPTYWKPDFFNFLKDEYLACREGVAIMDMSSFSKFQIKSAQDEAVEYLQRMCSNDVDVKIGQISPTGMQNERGGYENEAMLLRQARNSFFMVCPTKAYTRIADWLFRHLPSDNSVQLSDLTSMYTVIYIVGPKSKDLLSHLTDTDIRLSPLTYKTTSVGHASDVMILSFTNTGEPGYSLYIPSEYALHVYDQLVTVGKDYGIRNAGYLTLRFLRIEKFIPFWAEEIDSITTPHEIGRMFRVDFNKDYFIGKAALQRQHDSGVTRRLVHFTLKDHDPETDVWAWGKEPIFRNGVFVGHTTSAGYAFSMEKIVCLGFITNPDGKTGELQNVTADYIMNKNALFHIDIAGRRFVVQPNIHPPSLPQVLPTASKVYQPTLRDNANLEAEQ